MKKNDIIKIEINNITLDGSGVGRYDGLAVFVPNAVIGDVLNVRVLKVKSNLAYGKIEEILEPSKMRINVDCDVSSKCGGCSFRHIGYNDELKFKENTVKNNFKRIAGFVPSFEPIFSGSPDRYRNKAQYPVSIINGQPTVGFFSNHTHRVVPCEDCLLQPEEFTKIANILIEFIKKYNISVYDETTNKGLIRHLYLRKAVKTNEIMVCVVINGKKLPFSDEFCTMLNSSVYNISSIMLNFNLKETNVVLGENFELLYGNEYINDILCGVKVKISPMSFYQVNHFVAEKLYEKAAEYAEPDDKTIIDLYCGAGTIGLSMAKNAKQIYGVEIVSKAIEDAKFNAKQNGAYNAQFFCGDAKDAAKELYNKGINPDVVILDPPRKGCSLELIETVCNDFNPNQIVYVSCDSATLARDCKTFYEMGYNVTKCAIFDMFPRTGHVETIVLLQKMTNLNKN